MIITNATIHSPVERFATSLHIEGDTIVWMGDEDTAVMRARAYPKARVVDVQGGLITPSFHHPYVTTQSVSDLFSQGVTAAHVNSTGPEELEDYRGKVHATGIFPGGVDHPGIHLVDSGESLADVVEFLSAPHTAGIDRGIWIGSEDDVGILAHLNSHNVRGRVYVSVTCDLPVEKLAGWSAVVVFDGEVRLRLGELTQTGVPFSIGGLDSPWELITRALHDGPARISARAGFNALTRGTWRLTPAVNAPRGVLTVGGVADLAVWQVDALAVQAPQASNAQWSTDKRAGTPLLPALGPKETPPTLVGLMAEGRVVVDRGGVLA